MYDTVKFSVDNIDLFDLENLIEIKDNYSRKTGEVHSYGLHNNFIIRNNKFKKSLLIDGSLAKSYYDGSNLQTLNRLDTKSAIQKLSDELGLNFFDSDIYRIDIANNFIMNEKINKYFICLGELNFFKRSTFRESLYYERNCLGIVLNFYDKLKDLKKKRIVIPENMKIHKSKVLRYELRLMKGIPAHFNSLNVKGINLFDEDFYYSALKKWEEHYFAINKINNIKFNDMVFKNVKTLQLQIMLLGIKAFGSQEIIDMIELSKSQVSRNQYYRAMRKINEILSSKELTEPNELILELDEKVSQAVKYYR